ncbi:MAG: hypothetical protein JSV75_00365 [Candidatus Bathyarchaeota archaeon]|nr:MAG: hypothetical protein JSV75_00365 [Candidatus Bathyarchaeota archaeon]UCE95590.1 MAG: hypothetical protein JSV51_07690 [Candidatus Bathyarchaeota archaeon]
MGLFNANAPLASDLNLLLQVFIFILLTGGVTIAKFRRGFNRHGTVMGIAVFLNTISMAIVMIPSLQGFRGLFSMPFSDAALIVLSHSIMGTVVEVLGIWLVGVWLINKIRACARRKNVMRVTVFLWLIELLVGIYIYIMLYLPI